MSTIQFDRRHLAEVLRHARHLGWRPPPRMEGGWRNPVTGATVELDRRIITDTTVIQELVVRRHWGDQATWIPVRSVREAVDVLAALSILPPDMSSAWVAGHTTWRNPRRRISPDGYLTWCRCCGDDLWCVGQEASR
ncbi:MAG TPA: hypothetical protein VKZ67_06030 [Natronosporangium sp.]|nr:hypothetical protein [Natronosporangium sp.]